MTGVVTPYILAFTLFLLLPNPSCSATQTVLNDTLQETSTRKQRHMPQPVRATMLSATLPGLGQIYNRKYWKVPIIYAGFGALAYYVGVNNTEYQKFRAAYLARIDGNPNTVDDFPLYSTDVLQRAMNGYRRNLEVTYLLSAALYLLNILDANVDAHLMDFDVGEKLSLGLFPTTVYPVSFSHAVMPSTGITLRFNF